MFSMKPHVNHGIERRGAGTPGSELYRRLSDTKNLVTVGGSSGRGGGNAVLGLRLGQIPSVGCYVDLFGMFSRLFKCLSFKTLVQE